MSYDDKIQIKNAKEIIEALMGRKITHIATTMQDNIITEEFYVGDYSTPFFKEFCIHAKKRNLDYYAIGKKPQKPDCVYVKFCKTELIDEKLLQ